MVRRGGIVFRVEHQFVERFVAAFVVKEDEADGDVRVGERFDLPIEVFEGAFVDGEVAVRCDGEEAGEIDVEGGVLDPEGEGVVHHLDLETLFGRE